MKYTKESNTLQEKMFMFYIYLTYFLTIVSYLGLSSFAPKYLDDLNFYIKIYVCLFLIWRFNPFRKISFNDYDKKIAFHSGVLILMTTTLYSYFVQNVVKKLTVSFK
jgi:hypothetical protein